MNEENKAIEYYKKSIELNPANTNGVQMIKAIEEKLLENKIYNLQNYKWLLGKWKGTDKDSIELKP